MKKQLILKKLLTKYSGKKASVLDRMLLIIIMAGMILMGAFLFYLLWFMATNRSVTHLLPADRTTAFFELEDLNLQPRLDAETVLELTGFSATLNQMMGVETKDFQDRLAQGRLGLALVRGDNGVNELVFFFRQRSTKALLSFFESLGTDGEQLITSGEKPDVIYSYPKSQRFVFSFVGPYLFVANQPDVIRSIQAVYHGQDFSLHEEPAFKKSLANLPRQTWGRGYLDMESLFFGDDTTLSQITAPLKHLANQFSITIRKQPNGFKFNTLLSTSPELLSLNKGFRDDTPFAYSLTEYIASPNTALYIGGANLGAEWQNTLDTISELNPSYGIIMEGIVRAQVNRIFGEDVSLRNDLYPLFENEYALLAEHLEGDQLGLKLILRHNDRNFAKVKLEKLLEGFETLAAQFAPKLKIITLPDGTESRELVADSSRLQEGTDRYHGYDIKCLDVKDSAYGFCYAITEELVVMANHPDTIKETIDLITTSKFTLAQSQSFRQTLNNLSVVSDEITYLQLDLTNELLKNTKLGLLTGSLMDSFEAVTWIKHYFNDGVSTEGFLLLK